MSISSFEFDSLADWSNPYDVMSVYPFLTAQQARIACNFHLYNEVVTKAQCLVELAKSMKSDGSFTHSQLLFLTELINFDISIRDSLLKKFNNDAKYHGLGIKLEMEDSYDILSGLDE